MEKMARKNLVVAFVMMVAIVLLNGFGLHMMGLRHSGAHIMIESVTAFLVSFLAVMSLSIVRRDKAAVQSSNQVADAATAQRIGGAVVDVDEDAPTVARTQAPTGWPRA